MPPPPWLTGTFLIKDPHHRDCIAKLLTKHALCLNTNLQILKHHELIILYNIKPFRLVFILLNVTVRVQYYILMGVSKGLNNSLDLNIQILLI